MSRIPGQPQKPKPRPRGDIEWRELALCRQVDPEIFFPETRKHSCRDAKRICNGVPGIIPGTFHIPPCPVVAECLEYALAHREFYGVWGGLGEKEREKSRRLTGAA